VQVVIDHRDQLVFRFAVEVDEADLPLLLDFGVLEVAVALEGVAGGGLDDVDGQLVARLEVVEDAVNGVGVGGGELVGGRDVVDLDRDVFLCPDDGADLVVDGGQGVGDVLAAAFALHQRHRRALLGGGLRRERGAGGDHRGEAQHLAAGESRGPHGTSLSKPEFITLLGVKAGMEDLSAA
jgi:hypothetical protein